MKVPPTYSLWLALDHVQALRAQEIILRPIRIKADHTARCSPEPVGSRNADQHGTSGREIEDVLRKDYSSEEIAQAAEEEY